MTGYQDATAFDRWLSRSLREQHATTLEEALPAALLDLLRTPDEPSRPPA